MKKIAYKIMFAILFCSTLVALVIGGLSISQSKKEISKEATERLLALVTIHGNEIEKSINKLELLANSLIEMVTTKLPLDEVRDNPDKMKQFKDNMSDLVQSIVRVNKNPTGWMVFDSRVIKGANTLSFFDRTGTGKLERMMEIDIQEYDLTSEETAWWRIAMEEGEYWSDPYYWGDDWKVTLVSYSKRMEKDGEVVGVAGADFVFDQLRDRISKIKIYDSGYMFLMNQNFDILYHPDKEMNNLKTYKNGKLRNLAMGIERSENSKGILRYELDGKKKIMAYNKLKNGWILVASPYLEEMYSGVDKMKKVQIIVILISIIISTLISLILGKSISKPLLKFVDNFKRGTRGDLAVKVGIRSKDEIGILGNEYNNFIGKLNSLMYKIKLLAFKVSKENKELANVMGIIVNGEDSENYKIADGMLEESIAQLSNQIELSIDNFYNQMINSENYIEELEEVSRAADKIKESLSSTIEELEEVSKAADKIKENLSSTKEVSKLKKGIIHLMDYTEMNMCSVRKQTVSCEKCLGGLEDISVTASKIKENINSTNETSKEALEKAQKGVADIASMGNRMEAINSSVAYTIKKIDDLLALSYSIGEILVVINEFSKQTNLLALNAAITASKAGKDEKGFSFIVAEIRNLAERTNKETGKIEKIIKDIQNEVKMVKDANDKVADDVKNGLVLCEMLKKGIDEIIDITKNNDEKIENVANSIEEQARATNKIAMELGSITVNSGKIEEKSEKIHEISAKISEVLINRLENVKKLAKLAGELKEEVNFFKLENIGKKEPKEDKGDF